MRTAVLTSLFPTPGKPHQGVFAKRRWQAMAQRNHDVKIIQPLPQTPPAPFDLILGRDRALASRAPRKEEHTDFTVDRPSYLHIPRKPVINALRFGKVAARHIHKMEPREEFLMVEQPYLSTPAPPSPQEEPKENALRQWSPYN